MGKTMDPAKFKRAMEEAPGELFTALHDDLQEYMGWFARNRMARRVREALDNKSGRLAGSFFSDTEGTDISTLRSTVYTDSRYAPTQEHGATIRPKTAKALTIPMEAALTEGAGATRGRARSFGFTDTFVGKDTQGQAYIFRRLGGDKVEALFRLVPQVVIPARLGFFKTWAEDAAEREATLAAAVDRVFNNLGSKA